MADFEGDPIDLEVCANCPNRISLNSQNVTEDVIDVNALGEATIKVNEFGIVGAYISGDGKKAGFIREYSTGLALADNLGVSSIFRRCEGSAKKSFLQKIGISAPDCQALCELMGNPNSAEDVIAFEEVLDQNRYFRH